jgi:hypothetical protein
MPRSRRQDPQDPRPETAARTMRIPALAFALLVVAAALAPRAPAEDALAAALPAYLEQAWTDRGGGEDALARTIETYEHASRAKDAAPLVFERLVRARYFRAKFKLDDEDAQKEEYERALADGLRGLGRALRGDPAAFEDLEEVEDEAASRVDARTAGLLFWTTAAYGSTIESMSIFRQSGAGKRFCRLMERVRDVDERYFHAGPHRVLADYKARAPGFMGGDSDAARAHAEAALKIAPNYAENWMARARDVWKPAKNRARYEADLKKAIELADDAAGADAIPEQRELKARAKRLLEKAGEEF